MYWEERLKIQNKVFSPNFWIVIRHYCPCPLVLNNVKVRTRDGDESLKKARVKLTSGTKHLEDE
jgi:hypothetical protein